MTDSDFKTCGSCGAEVSDHAKFCPPFSYLLELLENLVHNRVRLG